MERLWVHATPDLKNARKEIASVRKSITKGKRFRLVSKVLLKHTVQHVLSKKSSEEEARQKAIGRRLRTAFEELGPTFIKLGQVLLTRQELLPDIVTNELSKLLNEVPPAPFEQIATVIEDELPEGFQTFAWIDAEPIGSASLAQVYKAELKDGRRVAVKVLRPNVDKLFQSDIAVVRKLVKRIQSLLPSRIAGTVDLTGLINEYYSSSMDELDMHSEAMAMNQNRANLVHFATLHIPEVYMVTDRVLVMEYIDGWNLKSFPVDFFTFEERMERMLDLAHYYVQSFLEGNYHADAHGANIMIDRHTKKAVILDWGMVGRMDAIHTEAIFRMLMHIRVNQAEDAAEAAIDVFQPTKFTDTIQLRDQFRSVFIHYVDSTQGTKYNWGNLTVTLIRIAMQNHCRVPNGLALWAKGFSAAEGTARWLCPEISFHSVVESADVQIIRKWLQRRFNYRANASLLAETSELVTTLPRRVNKILKHLEWNDLQLQLEARPSREFTTTLYKLANRVATGFLSGLLFLGSAILLTIVPKTTTGSPIQSIAYIAMTLSGVLAITHIWRMIRSSS